MPCNIGHAKCSKVLTSALTKLLCGEICFFHPYAYSALNQPGSSVNLVSFILRFKSKKCAENWSTLETRSHTQMVTWIASSQTTRILLSIYY